MGFMTVPERFMGFMRHKNFLKPNMNDAKKWKRASVIVSNPFYVPRPNQQHVDQSVNGCSNIVDSNGQFCNIQSKQKSLPAPPEKR